MNSSDAHILTSWFPLITIIITAILLFAALFFKKQKMFNASMLLIVFFSLLTLIVGASGGASMPKLKDSSEINHAALHLHAWSAFGAIAFAIILGILAYKRYRSKASFDLLTNAIMAGIGVLCIAFLIVSMHFAYSIRS